LGFFVCVAFVGFGDDASVRFFCHKLHGLAQFFYYWSRFVSWFAGRDCKCAL